MPYYECPLCGGTDSYGQWEQRFKNTNVSYYDNQRHPIGSSNNGFGVSNVRQQYCVSCKTVKMDFKLSPDDINFVVNLLRGIGNLLSAIIVLVVRIIFRTAPYVLICILIGVLILTMFNVEPPPPTWYIPAFFGSGITLLLFIEIYRKVRIRKEDNKFLKDRFHKIQAPVSRKRLYFIVLSVQILSNLTYLYLYQRA
jgi:hypothetical protein